MGGWVVYLFHHDAFQVLVHDAACRGREEEEEEKEEEEEEEREDERRRRRRKRWRDELTHRRHAQVIHTSLPQSNPPNPFNLLYPKTQTTHPPYTLVQNLGRLGAHRPSPRRRRRRRRRRYVLPPSSSSSSCVAHQ